MISPVLRPKLWSALLGLVVAGSLATPVWADPALPDRIPDSGSRPVAPGGVRMPGGTPATGLPSTAPVNSLGTGPFAAQIAAAEAQVTALGEQLLKLRQERTDAEAQLATADRALRTARDELTRAQQAADAAAADALKAAAALPPGQFAADLRDLSVLERISRGDEAEGTTTAEAGELSRARTAEQLANQAYLAAEKRGVDLTTRFTTTEKDLRAREAALVKLRQDNAAQLAVLERQQEATEQRLGAQYVNGAGTNGLAAHPKALGAVRYALAQLGDPYLWAAEGPDRFDCSGLIWAAYRTQGITLPRVSRDQYYATRGQTVDRNSLLPGDLVFYASGSSWTTIHHMGMYIGNGKMVHAPSTGDVVKISTVRWSRLYAATRVVGAVPGPATPAPVPSTTNPATPAPTGSATPKPTATATPKPTGTPTTPPPTTTPPTTPPPTTAPPTTPPPTTTDPDPTGTTPAPAETSTAAPSTTSAEPGDSTSATSTTSVEPADTTSASATTTG